MSSVIKSLSDQTKNLAKDAQKLADKPQIKNLFQAGKDGEKAYKATQSATESVKSVKYIKDAKGALKAVGEAGEAIGDAYSSARTAVNSFKKDDNKPVEKADVAASGNVEAGNEWDWESSEKEMASGEGKKRNKKSKQKSGLIDKAETLYGNVKDIVESDGVKATIESGESAAKHGEAAFNDGKDAYETGKGAWEIAQGAWKSFGSGGSLKDAVSAGKEIIGAGKDIGKAVKSSKSAFGEVKAAYGDAKDTLNQANAVVNDVLGGKKGDGEAGAVDGAEADAKAGEAAGSADDGSAEGAGTKVGKEEGKKAGGKRKGSGKKKGSGGKVSAKKGGKKGLGGKGGAKGIKTPEPKGKGEGKNAIEAFANSGLSYQIEHFGGLGAEVTSDLQKSKNGVNAKTPGVKDAPLKDDAVDQAVDAQLGTSKANNAKATNSVEATKAEFKSNDGIADGLKQSAAQIKKESGAKEALPGNPSTAIDTSFVNAKGAEFDASINQAISQGNAIASNINTTIPKRGVSDLHAPKMEISAEISPIATQDVSVMAEVAELPDEAKGLLESTEEGKAIQNQIEGQKTIAASADQKYQSSTDGIIAEHEKKAKKAIEEANAEQDKVIAEYEGQIQKEIADQNAQMQADVSAIGDEARADVQEAMAQVNEKQKETDAKVQEARGKAEKDQVEAEKETEKKKKGGFWNKLAEVGKSIVQAAGDFYKSLQRGIIKVFTEVVCSIIDAFAWSVKMIDKDLGEKLKKKTDKVTAKLREWSDKLVKIVENIIEGCTKVIQARISQTLGVLQLLTTGDTDLLQQAMEEYKAAGKAFLEAGKTALELISDIYLSMFKAACKILGIDYTVFEKLFGVLKEIFKHPGRFAKAFGKGIVQGFVQFGEHWATNLAQIGVNLLNIWLGAAGLKLDYNVEGDSLTGLGIAVGKLVLDLMGFETDKIIKTLGLQDVYDNLKKKRPEIVSPQKTDENAQAAAKNEHAAEDTQVKDDSNKESGKSEDTKEGDIKGLAKAIKKDGPSAFWGYFSQHWGKLLWNVALEGIKSIGVDLIEAGIAKLAMMATPVSGIVAGIKAVWDLIQFIRVNAKALSNLVNAVYEVLASAAMGNTGVVANAVEAVLCQAIPLVIDMLLRLCGVNVGRIVKKLVAKLQNFLKSAMGSFMNAVKAFIAKGGQTKIGQGAKKVGGKVSGGVKNLKDKVNNSAGVKKVKQSAETGAVGKLKNKVSQKGNEWAKSKRVQEANRSMGADAKTLGALTTKGKDWVDSGMFNAADMAEALRGEKGGSFIHAENYDKVKEYKHYKAAGGEASFAKFGKAYDDQFANGDDGLPLVDKPLWKAKKEGKQEQFVSDAMIAYEKDPQRQVDAEAAEKKKSKAVGKMFTRDMHKFLKDASKEKKGAEKYALKLDRNTNPENAEEYDGEQNTHVERDSNDNVIKITRNGYTLEVYRQDAYDLRTKQNLLQNDQGVNLDSIFADVYVVRDPTGKVLKQTVSEELAVKELQEYDLD